jgi:hypothetical protein
MKKLEFCGDNENRNDKIAYEVINDKIQVDLARFNN